MRAACAPWGSSRDKTNGPTRQGKQTHQCQACARQCVATAEARLLADAPCHTPLDDAAAGLMPAERPQAMTQQARHTHPIERVTTTLRPRVSRLGREPRSCSTTLAPHIGASQYFMGYDHLTRATAAALPG